jgi:hypothetical protein
MKHEPQNPNKYPTKKTLHIRNIEKLEELKQLLREVREKGHKITDGIVIDLALEYAYELKDNFITWARGRLVAEGA